jgi:hypothetical protein
MTDWDDIVDSLPDPTKDKLPPRVGLTPEGKQKAKSDSEFKKSLLNTKSDTERLAKYILEGRLFGGNFRKDGDWVTLPNGRSVYQKKVSDLVGGVPLPDRPLALTYVEVKGVSPGQSFAFSNLDKRNNPKQPSQQEKLCAEWELDSLVWLFIGWWDSDTQPITVERGSRKERKWFKEDCEMTGTLLRWGDWLELYYNHSYRSIRQKDRHLLDSYRVRKVGGRWQLDDNHWWRGVHGST